MHKEDIIAELHKKNTSLADVARELEVTRSAVSNVLTGTRSERIERAIAHKLEMDVQTVFPDRTYGD